MAQIAINQISPNLIPLIEDPQLGNLRMFVQGYSFQANSLSPNWMEAFQPYSTTAGQFGTTNSGYASYTSPQNGFMMLSGGTIRCTSLSNASTASVPYSWYNKMAGDTYHTTMDWANFPTQFQWTTKNGYTMFTGPDISSAGYGGWQNLNSPNCASPTATPLRSIYGGASVGNKVIYEDTVNNRLWLYSTNNTSNSTNYIVALTNYEAVGNPTVGSNLSWASYSGSGNTEALGIEMFFMGTDTSGYLFFLALGCQYQYYTIYRFNPVTYAGTAVITNSYQSNTVDLNSKRRPSNIRRDSASRRVFYSSHFNSSNQLQPNRYVWDPTQATGNVTVTACTMTYPGANTYATYGQMNSPSNASYSGTNSYANENWHMKPYQFSLGGTNYITFFQCDKYPTGTYSNNATYMWQGTLNRTIITYSIGSGTNDNQLTYHSSFDPGYTTMFRDFMPISASGVTLAVPQNDLLYFWTFNATSGWQQSGPYPVNPRVIGLDQLGRLWAQVNDNGFGSVHVITPSTPITVNVVMATSSFTYTGSNIATSANVTVSNSAGSLISTTVFLTVNGASMVFSNTGLKTQTITTSNVGGVYANLTITGGGYNTISASITSSQ